MIKVATIQRTMFKVDKQKVCKYAGTKNSSFKYILMGSELDVTERKSNLVIIIDSSMKVSKKQSLCWGRLGKDLKIKQPYFIPYAALCLQPWQNFVKNRMWFMTIKYWLHLFYTITLIKRFQNLNLQFGQLKTIIAMGICLDSLFMLSQIDAFQIIKHGILDIDLQNLHNMANKTCSELTKRTYSPTSQVQSLRASTVVDKQYTQDARSTFKMDKDLLNLC